MPQLPTARSGASRTGPDPALEALVREVGRARAARRAAARRVPMAADAMPAPDRVPAMLRGRGGDVDLGAFLGRCATLLLASSADIGMLMTSFPEVQVSRDLARAVAAAVAEIVYASGCAAPPGARASVFVSIDFDGAEFVLAMACPEAAERPVPTSEAAAALARAGALVTLLGGSLVRGVRDGMMLHGAAFPRERRP